MTGDEALCVVREAIGMAKEDKVSALSMVIGDGDVVRGLDQAEPAALSQVLVEWQSLRGFSNIGGDVRRAIKDARRHDTRLRLAGPDDRQQNVAGEDRFDHLACPPGWDISRGKTYRLKEVADGDIEAILVSEGVIYITGILGDCDSSGVYWHLEWRDESGAWKSAVVGREVAQQAKDLAALSRWGMHVNSVNSRCVVDYLARFEATNSAATPKGLVSKRLGWVHPHGFLWGDTLITSDGMVNSSEAGPTSWGAKYVRFMSDDGASQISEAYRSSGTWEGWCQTMALLADYPTAVAGVFGAVAAVLLDIIPGSPNFIMDWSGKSSHGKTTVLRCAASCWGMPSERKGGCIHTWDATDVGGERAAEITCDMPLIMDDTKRARRPEDVDSMLYRIYSGRGRLRGKPDGLRKSPVWRTIMLSSGEVPATSFSKSQGARARVLSLAGLPFVDGQKAALVQRISDGISNNYGHAGPKVVAWLLENGAYWPRLREIYDLSIRHGPVIDDEDIAAFRTRSAPYVALLEVAAYILIDELKVPLKWEPVRDALYSCADTSALDADMGAHALAWLYDWAASHRNRFFDGRCKNRKVTGDGWVGRWDLGPDGDDEWDWLAVNVTGLKDALSEAGYDADAIVADWHHRRWIQSSQGRATTTVRIDGVKTRCIVVLRSAFYGSHTSTEGPTDL